MTVEELLDAMRKAWPLFGADALESWAPVLRRQLSPHEGQPLKRAWLDVQAGFIPTRAKPYPVPMDFSAALPDAERRQPQPNPAFAARGQRARDLMAEWRGAQGNRAACSVAEIMRALEHIAEPIAMIRAFDDQPAPVRLTVGQVRVAHQRAISQERLRRHGQPGRDGAAWWQQIEAISAQWGVPADYAAWSDQRKRQEAA